MPRYTRCPYYIDESRQSISCEDVCRSYDSMKQKSSWMDMYCDSWDWMKCPYAADMDEAYRRYEEGDETALIEQELKAQKKEIESLIRKLGRANKRIERQQKKIDELRAVNQSYQRRNEDLYLKWRSSDSRVRAQDDKIWGEITNLSAIYEQRMAYLIDTYCPDKKLRESDVKAWAGDREFAIVAAPGKEDETIWEVAFKENEDDGKRSEDIPDNSEEPAE